VGPRRGAQPELQAANLGVAPRPAPQFTPLERRLRDADMSNADWQRLRAALVRGEDPFQQVALSAQRDGGAMQGAIIRAAPVSPKAQPAPARQQPVPHGRLTGRPGRAWMIAGALNKIAGGPNTSAQFDDPAFEGAIARGPGQDVRVNGTARHRLLPKPIGVGAQGVLESPSGPGEVVISGITDTIPFVTLPPRVRVFNTESGELDFHVGGPLTVFGRQVLKPGATYVIVGANGAKSKR
jgi:hypothetical protein